jgi:hypothetical protein
MKALWIRDLISQRFVIALTAVYSLFFFGLFAGVDAQPGSLVYVVSGIAGGLMITFGSFKADRDRTPVFMLSLPVTRGDAVNEKYLLLLASTAFGLVCAALFGLVLRVVGWTETWITGLDIVRVLSGMGILMITLPFYLRFGHKAVQILMVSALGLGVALQVGLLVLATVSSSSFSQVVDAVLAWYGRTPIIRRNVLWLITGSAVGAISFVASHLVYRRHEI